MTASTETTGRGAGSSLSAWRQSKKARFRIILAFKYLIAAIVLVYSLFPILWTISASFSPSGSISGQTLIPSPPTLRNYERILDQDFWLWMRNSFIISSMVIICFPGGFCWSGPAPC